jgi:hypothetical protein
LVQRRTLVLRGAALGLLVPKCRDGARCKILPLETG